MIIEIQGRKIMIKGPGQLYYECGLPISISLDLLKEKNIEPSYLHIADELLKNGFPPKRVISIFNEEEIDTKQIETFCNSDYETQREMIFDYLFSSKQTALNWAKDNLIN